MEGLIPVGPLGADSDYVNVDDGKTDPVFLVRRSSKMKRKRRNTTAGNADKKNDDKDDKFTGTNPVAGSIVHPDPILPPLSNSNNGSDNDGSDNDNDGDDDGPCDNYGSKEYW